MIADFLKKLRGFVVFVIALGAIASSAAQTPAADEQPNQANAFRAAIEFGQARMAKVIGAGVGQVEGYGSGIIVSQEGHIVTSQGVFLDGQQTRVILPDGTVHSATLLKRNREIQLALLKVDQATPDYFELSQEPVGEKGDWIVALNNAFKVADKNEPMSVMLGVIALRTTIDARINERDIAYRGDLVLLDAITSNPGAAGGAVLTLDSKLVGVIGKIINSTETNTRLNYAVPANLVADFVAGKLDQAETVASTNSNGGADLGLRLLEIGGQRGPAYIDRVINGGPAEQAGLRPDDLIVSIGGEKIGTVRDYHALMDRLVPNQEVIIVVKRGLDLVRIALIPRERSEGDK